jgi:hypothetical protein
LPSGELTAEKSAIGRRGVQPFRADATTRARRAFATVPPHRKQMVTPRRLDIGVGLRESCATSGATRARRQRRAGTRVRPGCHCRRRANAPGMTCASAST